MRILILFSNLAALCILSCFFMDCSPVPYANVGLNVPMIKNKGEVNLNAGYGTTEDSEGFALQAAASIDSSWSLMSSLYLLKNIPDVDWSGNGSYFDFAVGKFGSSKNGYFIYDGYIGVGLGSIKNTFESSRLEVKFIKPFVQGSIGYSHQIVDVALTTRFGVVNFTKNDFYFADQSYTLEASTFFDENKSKFVFEPGLTVRVGYRAVRLSLQYCTSTFKPKNETANVNVNTEYFSAGVNVLISRRWE